MKRNIFGIAVLLLVCLFAVNAFATATITASIVADDVLRDGSHVYHVKVTCLMGADADNPAVVSLTGLTSGSTALLTSEEVKKIVGGFLMSVTTVPGSGSAAPVTHTVALSDENGAPLPIDVTTTSTTASETFFPYGMTALRDIQINWPDIGDAADTESLFLKIYK
jgi:hypothetical protein